MKKAEHLASFCIAHIDDVERDVAAIAELATQCDERLQYYEIIYVAGESLRLAIHGAAAHLAKIRNLRVLMVSDDASYYHCWRLMGAAEAIGDVVTLTTPGELSVVDVVALADEAMMSNQIMIAQARSGRWFPLAHWLLNAISGFRVSARDMHTLSVPRDRLVALLARPSAAIALRFEPKQGPFAYVRKLVAKPAGKRDGSGFYERAELFTEIVSTSSPRFLKMFALVSCLVMLLASLYGLYAVAVYLTLPVVQPGWFSTAITQSGSVVFISMALMVVALGVARIIERLDSVAEGPIVEEIGNISFFESVRELNVEIETERLRGLP